MSTQHVSNLIVLSIEQVSEMLSLDEIINAAKDKTEGLHYHGSDRHKSQM